MQSEFTYSYDAVGNLLSASDSNVTHTYQYDILNRTILSQQSAIRGGDLSLSMAYDAVGNRTSVTDENGVSITSSYDARNRQASLQWQGGGIDSARVDYNHDQRGMRTSTLRYDDLNGLNIVSSTRQSYDPKRTIDVNSASRRN